MLTYTLSMTSAVLMKKPQPVRDEQQPINCAVEAMCGLDRKARQARQRALAR